MDILLNGIIDVFSSRHWGYGTVVECITILCSESNNENTCFNFYTHTISIIQLFCIRLWNRYKCIHSFIILFFQQKRGQFQATQVKFTITISENSAHNTRTTRKWDSLNILAQLQIFLDFGEKSTFSIFQVIKVWNRTINAYLRSYLIDWEKKTYTGRYSMEHPFYCLFQIFGKNLKNWIFSEIPNFLKLNQFWSFA